MTRTISDWTAALRLQPEIAKTLAALPQRQLPVGSEVFHPGEAAQGFVIVLSGRIEVTLTAASGREILLYAVEPGQSCIQTTLGLMGDEAYTGAARTVTEVDLVLIPKLLFLHAMNRDEMFRTFVLKSFGARMSDLTHVLEQVAFGRIEPRLANALLDRAVDGCITATQAELAARIGTAREVVTRKLEVFAKKGWISTERGQVTLLDEAALRQLAAQVF
jgi:CRP/FNR family transcriptional regulator